MFPECRSQFRRGLEPHSRHDGHKAQCEITKRELYDGYLVYQGGVPEVEEFVKKVRK